MKEWKKHFMEMLEGAEEKRSIEQWWEEEEEDENDKEEKEEKREGNERGINREEVIIKVRKLKKEKAKEEDGINNESLIHMRREIEEPLIEVMK